METPEERALRQHMALTHYAHVLNLANLLAAHGVAFVPKCAFCGRVMTTNRHPNCAIISQMDIGARL